MPLPNNTLERIWQEANSKYKEYGLIRMVSRREGYVDGATAENEKAQPLVDTLMNVRAFIAGATAGAMHPFTSLKTLDKEIEAVLQQWNGAGKEVGDV